MGKNLAARFWTVGVNPEGTHADTRKHVKLQANSKPHDQTQEPGAVRH